MTLPADVSESEAGAVVEKPSIEHYGRIAARGMAWVVAQTLLTKGMSFAAQLVLGWLLAKDDYAVYAIAISIASLVSALKSGGLQKVLIQRSAQYTTLAWPVMQVAMMFNVLCAGIIVGISPIAAHYFEAPALPPLLWVLACTVVLSTPTMIFQAKVLADLRFKRSAAIVLSSSVIQYASMIALALMGFGPVSFVLPLALVAIFETVAYGISAGALPKWVSFSPRRHLNLLTASGWMMISSLAITLINQGDFLIVGRMKGDILGEYFFGAMLAVNLAAIFGIGLNAVLMPTLSKLAKEPERFGRAYLQTIRTFVMTFTPLGIMAALAADPMVHLLWQGKWDRVIPVVQIFTISLLFRMLTPIALAGLEARARWGTRAGLLAFDAAATLVAAYIGCVIGDLVAVAIAVTINRCVMAVLQCLSVARTVSLRRRQVLLAMLPPIMVAGVAAICALLPWVLIETWPVMGLREMTSGVIFSVLYVLLVQRMMPRRYSEALSLIRSMLTGPRRA